MDNKELQHHGVKGMRWGFRKKSSEGGSSSKSKRTKTHEDYTNAHSKTKVKSMSNAELKARINRLQMEKQYSQLTAKEKSAGRKFVGNVLAASATAVATGYATKYMKQGVEAVGAMLKHA